MALPNSAKANSKIMRFEDSIASALRLMPRHRESAGKRASTLGLDDLIDELRSRESLDGGTLDLLFMGYRYRARALRRLGEFLKGKAPKPRAFEDLLVLAFASLMSRDKMSPALQVDSFVEVTGKLFGTHLKGVMNAWARQILRETSALETERSENPEAWLPQELRGRWSSHPKLLHETARRVLRRPAAGVWGFDRSLEFHKKALSEWKEHGAFQAMDPGSWRLVRWIDHELQSEKVENFLDACAAPGGKFVALGQGFIRRGLRKAVATEAKYPRLERLKENLRMWGEPLSSITDARVLAWGSDDVPGEWKSMSWDVILADLPCSGSGTFHTRPDLLSSSAFERLESLKQIQAAIVKSLQELSWRHLFVSICSNDPEEVSALAKILGEKASFESWTCTPARGAEQDEDCEALTAWHLSRS